MLTLDWINRLSANITLGNSIGTKEREIGKKGH